MFGPLRKLYKATDLCLIRFMV